jgi:hypothetical protein
MGQCSLALDQAQREPFINIGENQNLILFIIAIIIILVLLRK